jgi:hypothetical protein
MASVPALSTELGPGSRWQQIEHGGIQRPENGLADPTREIGTRRIREPGCPLRARLGIQPCNICPLLFDRRSATRLNLLGGIKSILRDTKLIAGRHHSAFRRNRIDIECSHLHPNIGLGDSRD